MENITQPTPSVNSASDNGQSAPATALKSHPARPFSRLNIEKAAKEAISVGFKVFPVENKIPLVKSWPKDATETLLGIREYWGKWPKAGIGAAVPSDILVIDADAKNGGLETLANLEKDHGQLNSTRRHRTGGGGLHIFYRLLPDTKVKNTAGILGAGIDTKTGGGYIVWPGSLHASGNYYEVLDDAPIAPCPDWILKVLIAPKKAVRTPSAAGAIIPKGERNVTAARIAGAIRRQGGTTEMIEAALREAPFEEPLPDREIAQVAASITQRYEPEPLPGSDNEPIHLTDMGNSQRMGLRLGGKIRFCWDANRWLVWTGSRWDWDDGQRIMDLARKTARGIYHEAAAAPDKDEAARIATWAKTSENAARLSAMVELAKSETGIPVLSSELNRNRWLLNCRNGTINLRTGDLQPHNPADLITLQVPVDYDPVAECPNWTKFLALVTDGDTNLQEFLQKAVGYSLTGDTSAQAVFLLYGLGQNGKSTFTDTIRLMLDGYSVRLQAEDLMLADRGQPGGPKEGIADLQGARFALGSELQDGRQLNTSLVKDISGQDSIKARRLYAHEVEFKPECKIWLFGNHKPIIKDTTLSIWRRVKLIPFTATIPDDEIIDGYAEKYLYPEWPGVLAWAIRGCLAWQQVGLKDVDAIKTATAAYRAAEDILGDFLFDSCILEHGASIQKSDLKALYLKWCEENKTDAISNRTFKAHLEEKGITDGRTPDHKSRVWLGIRVKTAMDISDISDKTDKTLASNGQNNTISVKVTHEKPSHDRSLWENGKVLSILSENGVLEVCPNCGVNNWLADPPVGDIPIWRCGNCQTLCQEAVG